MENVQKQVLNTNMNLTLTLFKINNMKCKKHIWVLFDYNGYRRLYYCQECEKVKSIKIK